MEAFPDYVMGKPRIDTVEVKIITDPNVMLANVLAGTVDLTGRQGVSMDQAVTVKDGWREGTVMTIDSGWTMMYPQFQSPGTPLILNPQFREGDGVRHRPAGDRRTVEGLLTPGPQHHLSRDA